MFKDPVHSGDMIEAARRRLRNPDVADEGAEQFAERVLLAHFERLPARPAGRDLPVLWREGLGEKAFELLLDYLAWSPLASEAFEWIATDLRQALLATAVEAGAPDRSRLVELAAALAVQAFRSEYVLAESATEAAAVARLEANPDDLLRLAVLGTYRPLHRLPRAQTIAQRLDPSAGSALEILIRTQIAEPQAEAALKPRIRALTEIADPASKAVQSQYEENPYPRWDRLRTQAADEPFAGAARARHLIAGCGTGQHPVAAARLSPQIDFVAVDLSAASLAYASRKAAQYGVANLEFAQADLLRLPQTGLQFDAISCVGVLHHLARPLEGLVALRALMSGRHGLKVAVYTESGRTGMVAAMALRQQFGLPATTAGIREFRQMIYALPSAHPARQIVGTLDFFSVSGCRDMVFHVVEHRYTLPAFADLVARAGLRIELVIASEALKRRLLARYPNADVAADIEAWHRFESDEPGCFGSMYRFMVAKA